MSNGWKTAMIGLAVLGLTGLVVVWRWQMLAADESMMQVVALPLSVGLATVASLWAGRRAVGRLRRAVPRADDDAVAERCVRAASHEAPSCPGAAVLDGGVCLYAGMAAGQVLGAVTQKAVWPQLDESLRDVEGNPVFTARVPALASAASPRTAAEQGPCTPTRVLRAREALDMAWRPLRDRLGTALADEAAAQVPPEVPAGLLPQVRVMLLLPADWSDHDRQQTLEALREQADDVVAVTRRRTSWSWGLLPPELLGEPEGLWAWVDGQVQAWAAGGPPVSLVLLAADSGLDDESIEQRQARGELFTAIHQQGRIPGEGAVALWLGSQAWVAQMGPTDRALVCLHRPVLARREKSADAAGDVGHGVLEAGLGEALSRLNAGVPLLAVISDADHRASRTSELVQSLAGAAPGLEAATALCRLGDACGDLGVVGPLAPVAVAAGVLSERLARPGAGPRAALAVCVQSPLQRVVVPLGAWPRETTAA